MPVFPLSNALPRLGTFAKKPSAGKIVVALVHGDRTALCASVREPMTFGCSGGICSSQSPAKATRELCTHLPRFLGEGRLTSRYLALVGVTQPSSLYSVHRQSNSRQLFARTGLPICSGSPH